MSNIGGFSLEQVEVKIDVDVFLGHAGSGLPQGPFRKIIATPFTFGVKKSVNSKESPEAFPRIFLTIWTFYSQYEGF